MTNIKSLKRIVEAADTSHDIRYQQDIAKAKSDYDKADTSRGTLSFVPKTFRRHMTNPDAHAKMDMDMEAAKERREAAKKGLFTKQDNDESKFEAAKAKAALAAKAREESGAANSVEDKQTVMGSIGKHLSDHPLPYVAAAAGIAGLAALQKRKSRLPEPGSYN
jgi:hypothetical protein